MRVIWGVTFVSGLGSGLATWLEILGICPVFCKNKLFQLWGAFFGVSQISFWYFAEHFVEPEYIRGDFTSRQSDTGKNKSLLQSSGAQVFWWSLEGPFGQNSIICRRSWGAFRGARIFLEQNAHTIEFTRTPSHARCLEVKDGIPWQHSRRLKQHILRFGIACF